MFLRYRKRKFEVNENKNDLFTDIILNFIWNQLINLLHTHTN